MKFSYRRLQLSGESPIFGPTLLKPIIPITLEFGERSLRYPALIDSGADFCIFEAQLGAYLGLDVESGQPEYFGGVQERGGAVAYFHNVSLIVGGQRHDVRIGFSPDVAQYGYGILGQIGFFSFFVVKFDQQKETVELLGRQR